MHFAKGTQYQLNAKTFFGADGIARQNYWSAIHGMAKKSTYGRLAVYTRK